MELGAGQGLQQVERPFRGRGDERQVDLRLGHLGQLDLGLLGGLLEALQGHAVLGEVHPVVVAQLLHQPVDDSLVPVVTAQAGVAAGGLDLEDALTDLQDGDVEGASAKVVDQDGLVVPLFVEPVGQGGGGGLVDDAQHFQAGDLAGFLGGLALGVAEVGGHGDDRLGDRRAQVRLGVPLELHQDAGADLLRGIALAVDVDGPVAAHLPLHRTNGAVRVGDGLPFGDLADQHFAALGEGDHRGCGAVALGVGDDGGFAALEDGHHAVGGAQVDAYCSRHGAPRVSEFLVGTKSIT